MAEVSRISQGLYNVVNRIIGDPEIINIRRSTTNLRDHILRRERELGNVECVPVYSGSKAEGLRFKSSDDDWMYIYRDIKVILSDSYMAIYDSNTTLLLMENEMTKPGFTLLRLIGEPTNPWVINSTESLLNGRYLSCKQWRELQTNKSVFTITHGPCASGKMGSKELDFAFCLQCDIWPSNARDCIRRLHQCGWWSHDTILSIVNDGVLFVPIGAKQSIFENTEWRMSFSLAEKKLIHSMNHTQFLCYGLLKIFLKETIDVNKDVKGLMCSYFLKTALFWEITTTENQWNPPLLLSSFWKCFLRLLQWVNCSYCPNFFIPQNNMFEGKIEGAIQDMLLRHLRTLHSKGYRCLLRCESLTNYMSFIIDRPVVVSAFQPSNTWIAMNIISQRYENPPSFLLQKTVAIRCLLLHKLATTSNNSHQRFLLKHWLSETLITICMGECNNSSAQGRCNRSKYGSLTGRLKVMQRFAVDSVTHILYQAMLCYKAGKYNQTFRLVQLSKEKISDPDSVYIGEPLTKARYRQVGGDNIPIETLLRKRFLYDPLIENDQHISELYIENHGFHTDFSNIAFGIPPIICALFLQYLCQKRLGCQQAADEALHELSLLVQQGDARHMGKLCAISWQILGICQQTSGDNQSACRSYLTALQQNDGDVFKVATCVRLGTILAIYF